MPNNNHILDKDPPKTNPFTGTTPLVINQQTQLSKILANHVDDDK